jgi:uncharacterized membrane protein YtjA (UPF0391 family)
MSMTFAIISWSTPSEGDCSNADRENPRRKNSWSCGSPAAPTAPPDSSGPDLNQTGGLLMLYLALVFLVVALIAGVLGLTGIAGLSANIAWILFVVGLILALISFVLGRRPPV